MGTEINLTIDGVALCWSKNHLGINHGILFQDTDYQLDDELEGCSYDEEDETRCLLKPLKQVGDRVRLLGHSHQSVLHEIEKVINGIQNDEFWDIDVDDVISAEDFGIKSLKNLFSSYKWPAEFQELISKAKLNDRQKNVLYEGLSPYSIIYLLSQCGLEQSKYAKWDFCHIVNAGWVHPNEIITQAPVKEQFLIVTEGTSDAKILKHGLELLYPHIADFFYFVDMDKGYPFTGVSSLVNFVKGLNSIKLLNNVIAIFDNDAAGFQQYEKISKQNLPPNIRLMLLPELEEFNVFPTIGPEGNGVSNINGSAVAIECFLDLNWEGSSNHHIRWGSYNEKVNRYQGKLEGKTDFTKNFLSVKDANSSYDFSKLVKLIKLLIEQAVSIKSESRITQMQKWSGGIF